jgi:hypothetical protein
MSSPIRITKVLTTLLLCVSACKSSNKSDYSESREVQAKQIIDPSDSGNVSSSRDIRYLRIVRFGDRKDPSVCVYARKKDAATDAIGVPLDPQSYDNVNETLVKTDDLRHTMNSFASDLAERAQSKCNNENNCNLWGSTSIDDYYRARVADAMNALQSEERAVGPSTGEISEIAGSLIVLGASTRPADNIARQKCPAYADYINNPGSGCGGNGPRKCD